MLWIFSPAVSNIDIFKVLYRSNTSVNAARWSNARLKPFTTDDSSLLDLIIKLNSCKCVVCENNLNTDKDDLIINNGEKSASRDDVLTRFCHYESCNAA